MKYSKSCLIQLGFEVCDTHAVKSCRKRDVVLLHSHGEYYFVRERNFSNKEEIDRRYIEMLREKAKDECMKEIALCEKNGRYDVSYYMHKLMALDDVEYEVPNSVKNKYFGG
jgi:hypothetical protein